MPLPALRQKSSLRAAHAVSSMRAGWLSIVAIGALTVAACGNSAPGTAQTGPVKVGIVLPLTGIAAAPGRDEHDGWNLALKEAGGKAAGRTIETSFVDDAGDPNLGLSGTRQVIENQKVDVYVSPIFANVALAARSYVASSGVPTIAATGICGAAEIPGYSPAPNIINSGWDCDQATLPLGRYVVNQMHITHVTSIGEDYAFGWETIGAFISGFKAAGGTVDKAMWTPIQTGDFAPYLSQISPSTQAVVTLMAGAEGPRFLIGWRQFGLKEKLPLIGGGTMTDFLGTMQPQDATGIITALQYADGLDTPANKKFVAAYQAATGRLPSYEAEAGYTAATLLVAALKSVNGNTSDRKNLIKALRSTPIAAPRGPVKIDSWSLAPVQNIYIRKVQNVNGTLMNVPIYTFENVPPWDQMDKNKWAAQYLAYSKARPPT